MSALALPARIGVVGDVHGDTNALVRGAFHPARRLGLTHLVQVGDFWSYDPRTLVKIDRQARLNGIAGLWFLDGNHENFTILGDRVDRPGGHRMSDVVTYLGRGTRLSVGNRSAVALGGAVSSDRFHPTRPRVAGKDWWDREGVTDADARAAMLGGAADILFTHDATSAGVVAHGYPPRATDTITETAEALSRAKLDRVCRRVRPRLHVHGHFHTAHAVTADGIATVCLGRNTKPGFLGILDSGDLSVEFAH